MFCRRQWYCLYKRQIEHYIENIDSYIHLFSPSDRLKIVKHVKENKTVIEKIIKHSHKSESCLVKMIEKCEIEQTLTNYEKSTPMEFSELARSISSIEVEETNTILREYQKEIIEPIIHKGNVKGKRKKNEEQEKKDNEKKKEQEEKLSKEKNKYGRIINKKSIIIDSVPNRDVIDSYARIKCSSYQDVSSQTAQQTLKKLDKAYQSFFESIKNPKLNAQLPKYLTDNHFNVIFQRQSFLQLKKSIRLSLGKKSKKDENSLNYLYIKTGHLPGKVIEAELVPSTNAIFYHLILKYDIKPTQVNQEKSGSIKDYASIDLGITNLATMYIPYKRPYIIDGSEIKSVNYETKRKNAKNQKNKVGKAKKDYTWLKREQKIKNYLHVASSRIIEMLKLSDVKHLIIGYNKGWKLKCNMGKQNNETFYKVPYRYFVNMLFYKGEDNGITVEETNESYTSK